MKITCKAINDRIKELDFQDCKVRVTNVDSQASDDNIVIQVIGEISNKSAPHRKFTQTFVLAGQTNGYFVLNDIFRYIIEEQDEVVESEELPQDPSAALAPSGFQEPAPSVGETVPETLTSSTEPAAVEQSAAQVDKELEEKVLKEEPAAESAPAAAVNGVASDAEPEAKQSEEAAPPAAQETAAPEATEPEAAVPAETPKDPEPTPAVSPPKAAATPAAAPQKPAAPAVPAVPKSWASLAAAANRSAAPVATPQAAPAAAAPQPKAAAAPAPAPSQSPAPAAAGDPAREASPATTDEWTSVGDNKKQQNRGQAAAGAQEQPQNRAYIKNVHENVDAKDLRSTLEKFGKLTYFDISRQKNCAFVDFETADGYQKALASNPHKIGGTEIVVEERRLKPGSYPYVPGGRGRGGSRGGSTQGQGRGNFQGRGGYAPGRGRGGAASRGRGGAQAA
ncbi:hypothetical protein M8818_006242 [Zalaria obscura]|uniref:Uncharacterized protein n=1 Tax=Zalaria obscura TaxID=2024903 RepID=A0ACC3S7R4_9PEZI